jgi:hypothetical protein
VKYYTHNQLPIDINGTHVVGALSLRYEELVAAFGKPLPGDGYKTDAEWHVRFADGTIATIYNWKNGPAYLGLSADLVNRINEWNIGGHSMDALIRVKETLLADLTGTATRLPLP